MFHSALLKLYIAGINMLCFYVYSIKIFTAPCDFFHELFTSFFFNFQMVEYITEIFIFSFNSVISENMFSLILILVIH